MENTMKKEIKVEGVTVTSKGSEVILTTPCGLTLNLKKSVLLDLSKDFTEAFDVELVASEVLKLSLDDLVDYAHASTAPWTEKIEYRIGFGGYALEKYYVKISRVGGRTVEKDVLLGSIGAHKYKAPAQRKVIDGVLEVVSPELFKLTTPLTTIADSELYIGNMYIPWEAVAKKDSEIARARTLTYAESYSPEYFIQAKKLVASEKGSIILNAIDGELMPTTNSYDNEYRQAMVRSAEGLVESRQGILAKAEASLLKAKEELEKCRENLLKPV
ncbi:hypothetical protein JHD46_05465 [Sulfurimonas sp. SAG-AH-194-C20]|nr:hypothetical protein [Sulfurimonas sp. SAG-AH-194-C20]MDF1879088.1 hypothetical protein [Sulfurimonas sp. SAG-AH-194-C20]